MERSTPAAVLTSFFLKEFVRKQIFRRFDRIELLFCYRSRERSWTRAETPRSLDATSFVIPRRQSNPIG
jgi:hypothetical protein